MAQAPAPTITSFSPATACQGGTVTITGTNLTGVTTVRLGDLEATNIRINSATSITADVADQAVSGPVTVTTPDGTVSGAGNLTILPAPRPALADIGTKDGPFSNCDGSSTYQLRVSNNSLVTGTGNIYKIDWGDNTPVFTQTDWAIGAEATHTYNAQGYFPVVITITPANGCSKSTTYRFYNGQNPLASFTTSTSTTGLCTPAPVEFQIGNWFNNSPGTTYVLNFGDGTPNVTLQHPLNATNTTHLFTHTYTVSSCPGANDFTATLRVINGCFTTTYTLNQIIIRKKPTADFSIQPLVSCVDDPVCFTNQTISGYSGNSCNTASIYTWNFGDGNTVTGVTSPCHAYTAPGTYTVTLTAANTACGNDVKTKQVVVNPISPPPVAVTPVVYCQGQPAVPLSATGTGLLWYTVQAGGTGSAVAPTPSTNVPGSWIYYVSQTLPNHCESPRVPVTVTVNALPAAPVVTTPVQLCLNQATTPLTATGTGLLWYTGPAGGIGSSTAPTPSTAATGSMTYYVSQTVNSCEGPRAAIVVTVSPLPAAPAVVSPVIYCQGQPAGPLTATGTGLLWYTIPAGGMGSAIAPTPSTGTPGSLTYYVSQATGCGESPRSPITVVINPSPSASIAYSPATLCNVVNSAATPNLPVAVTFNGTPGGSYSISPAAGLPINTTTGEINPSGASAGTYTISYTIAGSGGCANYTTNATVTVNGSPTAAISYPAICTSDAATNVSLTGTSGGAFTSTTGLTINSSTGVITPGTSTPGPYVVTYTISPAGPCPGFSTTANVTITPAPSASIAYSPATLCNVVNSVSTPNPPVGVTFSGTPGGSYSITPATGLPINTTTGEINPSGASAGTYTISYTIAGSGGCANYTTNATVTVNGSPTAAISYPAICTSDAATNVSLTGTSGGTFTATTGLTINSSTGVITPGTSTPGPYVVTYTISPAGPCPGFSTTANVTITPAPSASIAYSPATLCNVVNSAATPNPPVAVTFSGTPGGSYSTNPATGLQINTATGEINPSGASAGTYTIRYTVPGTGGCADYSATTLVSINSAPTAVFSYSGPYCGSITVPQPVTFNGTSGGIFSAGPGLSLDAATGAINPSRSTPGVYAVTYTIAPSSPCPGYTTTANVEIVESPVLTFPVPAQFICSGGTAVFVPASTVPNTIYNWSVAGALPANVTGVSSGATSGNISLSFTNTGTANRALTIRVTPVNPSPVACPGASYDLTLTVRPVVPAPVTDTANFCMDMPSAALRVDPLPGNTIQWYNTNMILLNAAPVINTAVPGMLKYFVTQTTADGCKSSASEIVAIVHPTVKIISVTYANPVACGVPSGTIVLDVLDLNNNAVPDLPVVVHYKRLQVAQTFTGNTDASGKITIPLTAGTYSEIYVETSGGCVSQKIPDVFVLRDPAPPAQPVAGYNPPVCSGSQLTLTALSATGNQAGPVNYVWAGPAFGAFADTVRNTVVTFPSADISYTGTYSVYAIQNNCISSPVSFAVAVIEAPAKPVISARTPLCVGDDLVLQAHSSISGNATLNYRWNGPAAGFPVNSPSAGISNIRIEDAGIYTVTVSSPQTSCTATSDTLIQVGGYPVVRFTQDTLALPTGYRLNLVPVITNANDPGILPIQHFTWTPSQDLSCNDVLCSSAVATIRNNICYRVTTTNIFGCSGSDDICINVFCQNSQVFVPNAFAPKGNVPGNRKLVVRATGISTVKSFTVFNRWGRVVFERSNFPPNSPDFGWDGMVNGKPGDTGVYVYTVDVICENGVPYTFKGNVTLL